MSVLSVNGSFSGYWKIKLRYLLHQQGNVDIFNKTGGFYNMEIFKISEADYTLLCLSDTYVCHYWSPDIK